MESSDTRLSFFSLSVGEQKLMNHFFKKIAQRITPPVSVVAVEGRSGLAFPLDGGRLDRGENRTWYVVSYVLFSFSVER
jgi:hypothetical protein